MKKDGAEGMKTPDIVEIKRLCASGQWIAKAENGKILLHDTVAGETVCIGNMETEPVRHGRWATDEEDIKWGNSLKRKHCTNCGKRPHFDKEKREFMLTDYCPHCGAKMDGGAENA